MRKPVERMAEVGGKANAELEPAQADLLGRGRPGDIGVRTSLGEKPAGRVEMKG